MSAPTLKSPSHQEAADAKAALLDTKRLKEGGIIKQGQADLFSVRLRIVGGHLTADQLPVLAEVATRYGRGYIHLTARQGIEVPHVRLRDIEAVRQALEGAGLRFGACGPRVRTIVACQGSAVCRNGLADALGLAQTIDERFYGASAPHKFKIAVSGCPNNCLKAQENDFGLVAGRVPRWDEAACDLCGLCEAVCPSKAIALGSEEVVLDESACNLCGDCVATCPTEALAGGPTGWSVYVGGKMGRQPRLASRLPGLWDEEEALELLGSTLQFYRDHGLERERFGDTLERVGLAPLLSALGVPSGGE